MANPTSVPGGWYADPADPSRLRYWDGEAWTPDTRPLPDAPGGVDAAAPWAPPPPAGEPEPPGRTPAPTPGPDPAAPGPPTPGPPTTAPPTPAPPTPGWAPSPPGYSPGPVPVPGGSAEPSPPPGGYAPPGAPPFPSPGGYAPPGTTSYPGTPYGPPPFAVGTTPTGTRRRRVAIIVPAVVVVIIVALVVIGAVAGSGDKRGNSGTTWFAGGVPGSWRPAKLVSPDEPGRTVLYSWATSSASYGSKHLHPTCLVASVTPVIPAGTAATAVLTEAQTSLEAEGVDPTEITLADGAPALQFDVRKRAAGTGATLFQERSILAVFGSHVYSVSFTTEASAFAAQDVAVGKVVQAFRGARVAS